MSSGCLKLQAANQHLKKSDIAEDLQKMGSDEMGAIEEKWAFLPQLNFSKLVCIL